MVFDLCTNNRLRKEAARMTHWALVHQVPTSHFLAVRLVTNHVISLSGCAHDVFPSFHGETSFRHTVFLQQVFIHSFRKVMCSGMLQLEMCQMRLFVQSDFYNDTFAHIRTSSPSTRTTNWLRLVRPWVVGFVHDHRVQHSIKSTRPVPWKMSLYHLWVF